ncbi:MAG: PEGA domain-containing protein [Lachnospiraceae bacterium]|nr:PEGA domain-containing protein [Lachnospiraceae bacterium]
MTLKSERIKRIRKTVALLMSAVLSVLCFSGCKGPFTPQPVSELPQTQSQDTGFVLYGTYDYDSTDTAILVDRNTEEGTLTFLNRTNHRRYTLAYDGTTGFYDRYNNLISLNQINVGDILNVRFVKSKRHLTLASLSPDAWTKPSTDQYIFDSVKKEVTIGSDIYKLADDCFCYSGKEELLYQELNSVDVLTFHGIDSTVYSINVDKGHGYLRLSGHEYFVGGWIEVGTKYIWKITEDMLLTVPEGTYNVVVSADGCMVDRSVTIKKGLETVLDLSDVVPEVPKEGLVLFSLTPSDATLYIDGEKADTSQGISLTYGLHQLMCTCDGYVTLTRYLSVGEENAGISITLEKEKTETQTDVSGNNDVSGNSSSQSGGSANDVSGNSSGQDVTSTSYYRVYINAPAGAECYIDGNYVGVVPCYFKKAEGTHVVTLSSPGCNTRSYTISVDNALSDMSFSFTDLEPKNP